MTRDRMGELERVTEELAAIERRLEELTGERRELKERRRELKAVAATLHDEHRDAVGDEAPVRRDMPY